MVSGFFSKKIFTILSDLSYSAYLFHGFFLAIIGAFVEQKLYPLGYSANECVLIIIICVIPFTYLFAFCSYHLIEIPGIALGRLIIKKM